MHPKFIFFFLALVLISCSKEDKGIQGKWNLVNVSGSIAGVNIDHPKGEIVWNFGESLVITNNYNGNFNFSFPTGKYDYEIKDDIKLFVNGTQFATITSMTDDELDLGQPQISDGVFYHFVR